MTHPDVPHVEELVQEARRVIAFEDDPHNAALQDNPESVKVSWGTWAAVFFMSLSFGPPIGLGVVTYASVIFPITNALGDTGAITWATGSWGLASAVSLGLTGPLSDVFGRRWPVLIGQALAIVGCSVCAAAQNTNMLIAGQAVNGFASGLIFISYAGVPEMLPNKHRALGLGLLEAGIGVPWGVVAIILGNALYANSSWRWIFYMSIIIEVVALVGTAFTYFPRPRPRGDYDKSRWEEVKEIDFIGVSLFAAGLTTLLIGLTWGGTEDHPWKSASTSAPIIIGAAVIAATMVYEAYFTSNPIYSISLFKDFRGYSSLWIVIFVASMQGFPMASLIPRGYTDMFTTDANKIGVYSLPLTLTQAATSVLGGVFAKKVGHIKWQLIFWLFFQAAFLSATAATVYPNNRDAFIWVPAFGTSLFPVIVLLAYAMASLHIPHSMLGLAIGLLGTARGSGAAVGSAIFYTVFNTRFEHYVGSEVVQVALRNGLSPADLPKIIPGAITYNLDIPHSLEGINGMTPAIKEQLRVAVRSAYGHSFKMVFYVTIPFTVVALLCGFLVKDVTVYMTNHTQFRMSKSITTHHKEDDNGERGKEDSSAASARHVEQTEVEKISTMAPKALH
ncbi:major facilitator superfamily transporter [Bisporella sp. PMI_857]|nr:major facilitator superfamily transporter [Bisporella sp. PMI_857]